MITMGGIAMVMFILRFFVFTLYESPKFLMGRGNDEQAVSVVHEVARRNGKSTTLTVEELKAFGGEGQMQQTDAAAAINRKLEKINLTHVRALFATPKMARSTALIIWVWALIGLAYPLVRLKYPQSFAPDSI